MANKKLENLVEIRQLKAEPATEEEVAGLLRSGAVRLADAKTESLSRESRFDLAYNAAHALSLAALRRAVYRSESRYLVFQCTQHTLALAPEHWRVLDQAHRKRNLAEYEGDVDVDDQLIAYSTPFRPVIPRQTGHPFQAKPATDSMASRPAIPGESGHR